MKSSISIFNQEMPDDLEISLNILNGHTLKEVRGLTDKYLDRAIIFKALGDPKRIMILEMLSRGELCVCKILEKFDMAQSTLSHHMGLLSKSGFVIGRNEGKWTYYSLNPQGFKKAEQIIELLSPTKTMLNVAIPEAKDGSI